MRRKRSLLDPSSNLLFTIHNVYFASLQVAVDELDVHIPKVCLWYLGSRALRR
jgi:hypothetical protein|eukprot:COSAG01_NODE_943_length_12551_cov_6.747992_2_plen_53_part_00